MGGYESYLLRNFKYFLHLSLQKVKEAYLSYNESRALLQYTLSTVFKKVQI